MKAEIRAITKCELAREVYDQKMDEQRMLSELILDASVKIGEFTKAIPKTQGKRQDLELRDSGVAKLKQQETKEQKINDLGFSKKQVERFEILANNKDVVEQVKAEARENDDIPTRSRVIDLVKQRKIDNKKAVDQIDKDEECYKNYLEVVYAVNTYPVTEDTINSIVRSMQGCLKIDDEIANLNIAISKLTQIKTLLQKGRFLNG